MKNRQLTMFGLNSFFFGFNVVIVITGNASMITWIALGLTGIASILGYSLLYTLLLDK